MIHCAVCEKEIGHEDTYMSEEGEVCGQCTLDLEAIENDRVSILHPVVFIGVIAAIVPFFFSVDYLSVFGGVLATGAGLGYLALLLTSRTNELWQVAVSSLIAMFGTIHLLSGFGVF